MISSFNQHLILALFLVSPKNFAGQKLSKVVTVKATRSKTTSDKNTAYSVPHKLYLLQTNGFSDIRKTTALLFYS